MSSTTSFLLKAGKMLALSVSAVAVFFVLNTVASAQDHQQGGHQGEYRQSPGGYEVVQPYGRNVYRETPAGERSEAHGSSKYGPHHLRRISPTEHLPAAPQVEKTIPTGQGGY